MKGITFVAISYYQKILRLEIELVPKPIRSLFHMARKTRASDLINESLKNSRYKNGSAKEEEPLRKGDEWKKEGM